MVLLTESGSSKHHALYFLQPLLGFQHINTRVYQAKVSHLYSEVASLRSWHLVWQPWRFPAYSSLQETTSVNLPRMQLGKNFAAEASVPSLVFEQRLESPQPGTEHGRVLGPGYSTQWGLLESGICVCSGAPYWVCQDFVGFLSWSEALPANFGFPAQVSEWQSQSEASPDHIHFLLPLTFIHAPPPFLWPHKPLELHSISASASLEDFPDNFTVCLKKLDSLLQSPLLSSPLNFNIPLTLKKCLSVPSKVRDPPPC